MKWYFVLLVFQISSVWAQNPVCITDSCRKRFLDYTVYYGSFPKEAVKIDFVDSSGREWSEMVFVVQIHNYYAFGEDSSNYKKNIDLIYQLLLSGKRFNTSKNSKNIFQGYKIDEIVFGQLYSLSFKDFLKKCFDREGNINKRYSTQIAPVWAVCFLNNVTFYLDEYYYPAIHEATWESLCKYYPELNKLPEPKKKRYIE
jgi:hypothetical protein